MKVVILFRLFIFGFLFFLLDIERDKEDVKVKSRLIELKLVRKFCVLILVIINRFWFWFFVNMCLVVCNGRFYGMVSLFNLVEF